MVGDLREHQALWEGEARERAASPAQRVDDLRPALTGAEAVHAALQSATQPAHPGVGAEQPGRADNIACGEGIDRGVERRAAGDGHDHSVRVPSERPTAAARDQEAYGETADCGFQKTDWAPDLGIGNGQSAIRNRCHTAEPRLASR